MRFEAIADPAGTAAAMELFNDCSAMGETLFRPFGSPEDFRSFFLRWTEDVIPVALAGEGAFASGCYAKESGKAYVTFVGVRPAAGGGAPDGRRWRRWKRSCRPCPARGPMRSVSSTP